MIPKSCFEILNKNFFIILNDFIFLKKPETYFYMLVFQSSSFPGRLLLRKWYIEDPKANDVRRNETHIENEDSCRRCKQKTRYLVAEVVLNNVFLKRNEQKINCL